MYVSYRLESGSIVMSHSGRRRYGCALRNCPEHYYGGMETFHTQKNEDFSTLTKDHLDGEIEFYEQVGAIHVIASIKI